MNSQADSFYFNLECTARFLVSLSKTHFRSGAMKVGISQIDFQAHKSLKCDVK